MRPRSTCSALVVLLVAAALLTCYFLFAAEPRQGAAPRHGSAPLSLQQQLLERNPRNPARDNAAAAVQGAATVVPLPTRAPVVFEPEFEGGTLQKRAFSSKMRFVFLVGLEGTGHHYMANVLDTLCKAELGPCPRMCVLAEVLYPSLANAKSLSGYKASREKLRREMQTLARYPDSLPEGHKGIMAGFGPCRFEAGMMSYPNFNGVDKALQYVDFRVMAEEAERAGIDLRIVYLTRMARSILISDTQHNNYGESVMKEARILITNAAVVESTFRELGPGFTTCLRYENITDPVQASRVAEFVAPTNESALLLSKMMVATVKDKHAGSTRRYAKSKRGKPAFRHNKLKSSSNLEQPTEEVSIKDEAMVVERLQQKLDKIERDQCGFDRIR